MSRLRRTGLRLDDPLAPAAAESTRPPMTSGTAAANPDPRPPLATPPADGKQGRQARRTERAPSTSPESAPPPAGAWRAWSGATRVASYRLPDELLAELATTASDLHLPVGLVVTAAIAHLLDESADTIAGLVDRADDARIQGRRRARRGASRPGAAPEASSEPDGTL